MAKNVNSKYLSNVLTSIKYATIDAVAELNPVIASTFKTNKGFISETIEELKESAESSKKFDYKGLAKETYANFKEDIKTGNLYNKQRMKSAEDAAVGEMFGLNMDDIFGEDDDDYDEYGDDDYGDYGDDDSGSSSVSSDPLVMKATQMSVAGISRGVSASNARMTSALGSVMIETSNINTKAIGGASAQVLAGINSSTAMMHKDLSAMNQNMAGIVTFTNEALRTHIENSTTFYDAMTQNAQEQTALLRELVDIQKSIAPTKKDVDRKTSIGDIFSSEGVIDLRVYKNYLRENKGMGGGTLQMINENMPALAAMIKGSPTGAIMKAGIKKAIPKGLKYAFEDVNELAMGLMGTALVNLTQAKKGKNGAVFQKLGEMFGLKIPDVTKMETDKYDKGAAAWTGKDHKALTVVIPKYLSDIYSAVSGKDGSRYDYDTGKFVKTRDIKNKFEKQRKDAVKSANYGINYEMAKQINKIKFSNEEEKKQIMDAIEKIQEYNFKEMKNFNPNSKVAKDLDPKTYGITGPNADNIMQIVKMLYTTIDKKVQLKGSTELLESVSKYNETLREQELSGDHLFNALFDDSIEESKIIDTPIMAAAKRLDDTNFILNNILDAVSFNNKIAETTFNQQAVATGGTTTTSTTNKKKKKEYDGSRKKDRKKSKKKKVVKSDFSIGDDLSDLEAMLLADEIDEDGIDTDATPYTQRIRNAEHASDKLKEFFKGFSLLSRKPLTFMKGAVDKVDEYAYSLFFGNGEEDVKSISGKIMKGFDNVFHTITEKTSNIFTAVADEVKNEGKATANGVFKAIFGIDFKAFKDDLKESLFGDEDVSFFSGMGKLIKQGMGEIFGDFLNPIKKFFHKDKDDIPSAARGMKVTKTGLVAVSAGERIIPGDMSASSISGRRNAEKTAIGKFKNRFGLGSVDIDNYAEGGFVPDPEIDKKYRSNMRYEEFDKFYRTLRTDEERNYYFNKFTKDYAKRLANKVRSTTKEGSEAVKARVQRVSDQIREKNPAMADAIDREVTKITESKYAKAARKGAKAAVNGAYQYGKDVKEKVKGGYQWIKDEIDMDDEFTQAFKDLMGQFAPSGAKEVVDDVAKNWKKYIPKTLAGGALGAGVSLLTGLAGGPLLGAAVGSAVAFASKSNAIQKMIFGEEIVDDQGNVIERKDGMFKREVSDAVKKYAPDMVKGGVLGTALSVLPIIPGSPVVGLMVGSAIGYAKNNEELMEVLGGTREKLANITGEVKKKLPAMGLGALAGALAGPFGLTTNLLVGSALGFASDTEKFKQMIFGYKGMDGKRAGGLVGIFKKLMAPPIQGLTKLIEEAKTFFTDEVFKPLKKAIKPLFQEVENIFNKLGDTIADSISTHITKPIGNYITDKFLVPLEKKFLKFLTVPVKLGRRAVRTAISPVVRLGRGLERRQLKKVGYGSGTAADRIARREEYIEDFEDESSRVFDPLSKIPGIGKYLARTPLTRTGRRAHNAEKWRDQFQNSESAKFDEYMTSGISVEEKAKLRLLNQALGSNIFSGDKGVEKFAKSVLVDTQLTDILNNLAVKKKIPYSYLKTITNELIKGECTISVKLITNNAPDLTQEERIELCKRIKEVAKKVQDGIKLAETANEEADRFEQEYGFSIRGRAVGRALDKEIAADEKKLAEDEERKKNATLGPTPEEVEAEKEANAEERETVKLEYINTISTDVHEIAEAVRAFREKREKEATGEAQDIPDNITEAAENLENQLGLPGPVGGQLALPGPVAGGLPAVIGAQAAAQARQQEKKEEEKEEKEDERYEYTDNGIVKLVRNDRDELEVDDQDSDTKQTLRRRDNNQQTENGILGKLSGIGTSLLDFFSGKNEDKKPSIFSRILSVLGLGFSFLGGSSIFKVLKLVAGGALLSYGIGKLTQKDENGESLASKIGDKIKPIVGDTLTNIGNWWNDKAKPWILEDFIPTTINGLGTALKGALSAGGWLLESISTMLIDIAPDLIAAMATGLAKAVWNGIKGIFGKGGDSMDSSEIEGDEKGYKKGETEESINFQTSTNVSKNKVKTQYKTQKNSDGTSTKVRDVQAEIKNSNAYNNIKNSSKKSDIASNQSIQQMWDQDTYISDADGNAYTLGELANTSGVYIMDDKNGNPVYSDDIFSSTNTLKKVIGKSNFSTELSGDYGAITNEEREENTGLTASDRSNIAIKAGEAVLRNHLTGGKLDKGLLKAGTTVSSKIGGATSKVLSKFGMAGKAASVVNKVKTVANAIPTAAVNFDNTYMAARAGGETFTSAAKAGTKEALNGLPFGKTTKKVAGIIKDSVSKTTKAIKGGTSKIKDVAADKLMDIGKIQKDLATVENVAGEVLGDTVVYTSNSKLGNAMLKIKDAFTKIFGGDKLIETITKKLNKGVDALSKKKSIAKETVKNVLKKGVDSLVGMLPSVIGDKINSIAGKIAQATASGGATYIASAVTGFLTGFKNADAYFEVGFGDVKLVERVAAGLLGIVQEFTFGIFDVHFILSWALKIIDGFGLKSEDLTERQEKLEEIVQQYNDEYGTDYTPYDFIMDDKIETKIMKFFANIGKGIYYTAKGTLQTAKTVLWDGAAKGVVNLVGSVFNSDKYNYENWKAGISESASKVEETKDKLKGLFNNDGRMSTKKYYKNYMNGTKTTGISEKAAETAKDTDTTTAKSADELASAVTASATTATNGGDTLVDAAENQLAGSLAQVSGCTTEDLYNNTDRSLTGEGYNTVNAFNEGWSSLNSSFEPLLKVMNNDGDKLANMVSKNIAVAMGLADADEDVTLEDILSDNRYASIRAKVIQDTSLIASITGGVTGSNSNSLTTQESAARKALNSTDSQTSTQKQINKLKSQMYNSGTYAGSYMQYSAVGGSGTDLTGKNTDVGDINPGTTAFVSQNNSKYANMTFGNGNLKQTVSDAGCAPTSAMMAINANVNTESTIGINEALKTAGGYIAESGGVTADYFADEFAKHGFKTAYVPKKDKNQRKILMHQLNNGVSVVLMGKDEKNTSKKNSPFGSTYHYVVATGLSEDGKYVYINDPESSEPNKKYLVDDIFNNSDLSIVPIKAAGRIGSLPNKIRTGLSGYAGSDTVGGFIYIGDSRVLGIKNALSYKTNKQFVANKTANLAWLKASRNTIIKLAQRNPTYKIIINLGLNDLDDIDRYISYYKAFCKDKAGIKNRIYYMSVTPVNEEKSRGKIGNANIKHFNAKLKTFAGGKYINIYDAMIADGFDTGEGGVDYTTTQYKKIHNYVLSYFNGTLSKITASVKTDTTKKSTSTASTASTAATSSTSSTSDSDTTLSSYDDTTIDGTTAGTGSTKIRTFAQLISAIGSMLSGSYGLTSSETSELTGASSSSSTDSSTSTGGTTTINTGLINGTVSSDSAIAEKQKAVIAKMLSVEKKLKYSQSSRNPENGSGDCSSTVQWAYKKTTGVDVGSYTGAQITNKNTKEITKPGSKSGKRKFSESNMQLGDILLYGNSGGGHVELYFGNGKSIGHGGPGKGPKVKNMNYRSDAYMQKRLKDFIPGGKGSGLFVSQNDSKWSGRKLGDETVATAGCAPAVATMAINNSKKYNMNQAIKEAANYKQANKGGVSADYFVDTFKKQGYNTIVLKDKAQIIKMLAAGHNVVLIGQDSSNKSKRKSPFGAGTHYVLATSITQDEKYIFINDPELKQEDVRYDTDTVFRGVQLAIIPVSTKNGKINALSNSLTDAFSGISGSGSTTNKIVAACSTMRKKLQSDKKGTWTYSSGTGSKVRTYKLALKNKVYKVGPTLFVNWAMKQAGLYPESGTTITPNATATDGWGWSSTDKKTVLKNFELITITRSKTAAAMAKSGDLKPGDIISYANKSYTNIYAGNNHYYDAGKDSCDKDSNGKSTNIFSDWYVYKPDNTMMVKSILRAKSTATASTASTAATNTTKTNSDGTTTTTNADGTTTTTTTTTSGSSESTLLDDLTKQFALLAEGWGLNSLESNSTDGTTDSTTSTSSGSTIDGSWTKVTGSNNHEKVWNFFKSKGIPDYGIAGFMGNLEKESEHDFKLIENDLKHKYGDQYVSDVDSGKVSKTKFTDNQVKSKISNRPYYDGKRFGPGFGLAQWTDVDRKTRLYNFLKKDNNLSIGDPEGQMNYLWKEIQGYKTVYNTMKEGKSIRTVSDVVLKKFERPKDQGTAEQEKRAKYGEAIYKEMTGKGSGLAAISIPQSASKTIKSINKINSSKSIPKTNNISIYGKGTGLGSTTSSSKISTSSSTPVTNYIPTANSVTVANVSSNSKSADTTNTLLNAIVSLLTQEVKNTAFIEGIANAIVSLVDAKAESTEDVSTKKQLLNTKGQILQLVQQQNNTASSTSLGDLIKSVESIIAQ